MKNENEVQAAIAKEVASAPVVMYVKGSAQMPMCGFSKGVMDVFTHLGVPFKTVDVLADPDVREGVKRFTQWPTIPQIFINGQFIGGFDIVRDMYEKGELQTLVKEATRK